MPQLDPRRPTGSLRKLTALVLGRAGHHFVQAEEGESALLRAKERGEPFDLLVTDLTMLGIGGRQLAAELRRLHPLLKVIFTSGSEEAVDLTRMTDGVRSCA